MKPLLPYFSLLFSLAAFPAVANAQTCEVHCPNGTRPIVDCDSNFDPCNTGGGGGYTPPAPNPALMALQRANSRFAQVIQDLPEDLVNRDAWLSSKRSTEEQFVQTGNELFTMLIQEIVNYQNSANQWRNIGRYFDTIDASYPGRMATLNEEISLYSQYESRDEGMLNPIQNSNSLLSRTTEELSGRTDELRNQMQGDRDVVSEIFSVLLPPSMVIVNQDIAAQSILHWPVYLDFPISVAPVPAVPSVFAPPFPASEVPELASAAPIPVPQYAALSGAPEQIVGALENTAQQATQVYEAWSDLSTRESARKEGMAQKVERLQALSQKAKQVCSMAQSINQTLLGALSKSELIDKSFQDARNTFAMQAVESMIWREGKRVVMDTIRNEYREFLTDTADLTDQQTFDHYAKQEANIFSLPDTIDHALKMKALQNNILTLLQHGTEYAQTAALLIPQASPSEIQEFAEHLFQGMSEDSEALVKSSLKATNIPGPFKIFLTRYIISGGNN
ncbi:MAG: hypothetical protein ACXWPM_03850 [Bdellovibrionota bacterium]